MIVSYPIAVVGSGPLRIAPIEKACIRARTDGFYFVHRREGREFLLGPYDSPDDAREQRQYRWWQG